MTDSPDRELLLRVHRDLEAAHASAKKLWGNDAGEETLRLTADAFLVHLRESRRQQLGGHQAPAGEPSTAATANPPCPKCGTVMQPVPRKSAKTPDFRCPDRACDTPMWLHKRNGAHA